VLDRLCGRYGGDPLWWLEQSVERRTLAVMSLVEGEAAAADLGARIGQRRGAIPPVPVFVLR